MVNDNYAYEVYKYAIEMKCVVHLYVEHFVKGIVENDGNVVEEGKQVDGNDVGGGEQGFGNDVEGGEQDDENDVELKYDEISKDEAIGITFDDSEGKKIVNVVDNIGSSYGVDNEMKVNYANELDNNDHDASDNEKRPKYDKFMVEELDRNYKLKMGLEFTSLKEFKAITE
ncbi:hypothetical protein KIW84_065967 [Lathyrus oleraceus]|uniref:Uncharacterized protein n=1 Tax=Pisum sativum TaxID=3888 RepID=A0A9D5AD51_PEA|nr:hypothetical protein KIW84_065967 [Pisum sativum]